MPYHVENHFVAENPGICGRPEDKTTKQPEKQQPFNYEPLVSLIQNDIKTLTGLIDEERVADTIERGLDGSVVLPAIA